MRNLSQVFQVGDSVDWFDEIIIEMGPGPFHVIEIGDVPPESIRNTGHPQKIKVSKTISGKAMVFSPGKKQWCTPVNNPHQFLDGPSPISGAWFKKI